MPVESSTMTFSVMQLADVAEVVAIENAVHSHPWTKGNFVDSLDQQYDAWIVRDAQGDMIGYFVQMNVVDETQLLTIAVKKEMQGQGVGRLLLQKVIERAMVMNMEAVSLEVRVSNLQALSLYKAVGFSLVGRRKNYYVTDQQKFEDALIFRYALIRNCTSIHTRNLTC